MTSNGNGKAEWYLCVHEKSEGRFGHFNLTAVRLDAEDKTPRNISHYRWENEGLEHLADLVVTCQWEADDFCPYGWRTEYDMYRVTLERAEVVVKTLRTLERKLAKIEQQWGAPTTFGQYAQRVGKSLGASGFVYSVNGQPSVYSDGRYNKGPLTELPWHMDWRIEKIAKGESMTNS